MNSIAQPRILVVDDERSSLQLLSMVLRHEGHLVDAAGDGPAALESAAANPPDLVLMDILMPGMNGFETVERLRNLDGCRAVPVIFLTGMEDLESKLRGFAMGAVDYVVKPFHLEEVRARVRIHLQLAFAQRELAEEQGRRLRLLGQAQREMMVRPADLPEARFAVHYAPAQEAGGDLYDVLSLGPGIHGYLVADVSGHDVGTSLVATAAKALLRQYAGPVFSPEETLRLMNRALHGWLPPGRFLTACYVRLNRNTGNVRAVSAGHPAPILIESATARIRHLDAEGDVLGAFPQARFGSVDRPVRKGDRVVVFTDGLFEGFDGGFDSCRAALEAALSDLVRVPLEVLPERLVEAMGPTSCGDDVVALAFEV
jgi:sigma-B regulation protein RsbU (phosphoserine phosphatase)